MGRRNNSQVIGYRYLFGIHMGISRGPVNELVQIKVGGKTAWFGSVKDNASVPITQPDLFGGDDGEGGIRGTLTVMMGGPTQTAPTPLSTVLKSPMPGFRRMFTAFFDGMVTAINPYPKKWEFRARRTTAGWDGQPWYPEKATISLVREVTQGETEQSGETQIVTGSDTVRASQVAPGVIVAGVNPPGTVISFDSVYIKAPFGIPLYLNEGSDFTVNNNIITFTPGFIAGAGGVDAVIAVEFVLEYTYTLNTTTPGSEGGTALIQAMNPAHIIYECYTNREWGRGLPRTVFDDDNWRSVADTLFNERFGLCIRWTRTDSIQSFIQVILDHIGAVIYPDRTTGKIKIKLIRDDYVREALPLFDNESGLLEISEAAVSAQGQMINEVRVNYRDPISNEDRSVRANNIASVQAAGGVTNSSTKDYKGLPTAELASRVAKRELRSLSPSIRRFNITLDRRGYDVVPGGVIRVQDLARNITDTVLRVGTVDYGSLRDGKIKVVAMQDLFGLPSRGYATIGPPQWSPPNTRPCVSYTQAFELPYRSVYRAFSPADFSFIAETDAYLGVIADEGNPLNLSFDIAVRSGAVEPEDGPPDESYSCGPHPRIVGFFTLDSSFAVSAREASTLNVGYGVSASGSQTLDVGYVVTAQPVAPSVGSAVLNVGYTVDASSEILYAGFGAGATNQGTLDGYFSQVNSSPGLTTEGNSLIMVTDYMLGNDPPDPEQDTNGTGLVFNGPTPTYPQNTSRTFRATIRFEMSANHPPSSAALNAAYVTRAEGEMQISCGRFILFLVKPGNANTFSLRNEKGQTLGSGLTFGTDYEVIMTKQFGFSPPQNARERYYLNGTLVASNIVNDELNFPIDNFTSFATYVAYRQAGFNGQFGPVRAITVRGIITNMSFTVGSSYP